MKIVDIDKLFNEYLKEYLEKVSPKKKATDAQIEKITAKLYSAFADTRFTVLDGYTPSTFYENKGDELIEILSEHFKQNVPVSDFLIEAVIHHADAEKTLKLLDVENEEELIFIAIEVITEKLAHMSENEQSETLPAFKKSAVNRLIALLFDKNADDCVKDAVVEALKEIGFSEDEFIEKAVVADNPSGAVCELLSTLKSRDNRITEILVKGFKSHPDNIPEYCSYFVDRFDESVLPVLYEALNSVNDYVDYKELCLAIEALGGEPPETKDFSNDKNYKLIKEASKNEHKNNN